ncbi:MAG: DinB family protein [Dehalococcoidia bacterium]|nr:DinB family protein [Dehalococcoidia bacterium]
MTCAFHLVDDVRNARSELLAACQDVSDSDLRRRPPGSQAEPVEAWAIIELLAHLPDVDRYYRSQAQQIRDVPGHMFVYFDENGWALENADAIERDAHAVKLAMAAAHDEVVRWTRGLTLEELDRAGGHPRRGSITVRQMVQRIANHDRTHTDQVRALRRALAELG